MKRTKKVLQIIIVSIIVIFFIICKSRIIIGYAKFGFGYCAGHHEYVKLANGQYELKWAGEAITKWRCDICGFKKMHSNTDTPAICSTCSIITGRCPECGELLKHRGVGGRVVFTP